MSFKEHKIVISCYNASKVYTACLYKNLRILEVNTDCLIAASGYKLYKLIGGKQQYISKLNDPKYSIISNFKLLSRFFRAEIHFYKTLGNHSGICIAKKGIFLENKLTGKFEKVFHVMRGSRPLNICEDNEGTLYFGEYFDNKNRDKVDIYASFNGGKKWEVIYTFSPGSIRHIHGIQIDPYTGFLWIVTGDEDGECTIACTKDKFTTLEIVANGGQEFRACGLLFLPDKIVYGTDSPYIENYIKSIDRITFQVQNLQKVQGSVMNSCQIGNICAITTTVEPSKVNETQYSFLWVSRNGSDWQTIACYKKDIYNMTLFQFGNLRLPHYAASESESLFISGHALNKIDRHTVEIKNLPEILISLENDK
jgi:hypothetical protein